MKNAHAGAIKGMSIAVITILFLSPIFYMVCQKLLDRWENEK